MFQNGFRLDIIWEQDKKKASCSSWRILVNAVPSQMDWKTVWNGCSLVFRRDHRHPPWCLSLTRVWKCCSATPSCLKSAYGWPRSDLRFFCSETNADQTGKEHFHHRYFTFLHYAPFTSVSPWPDAHWRTWSTPNAQRTIVNSSVKAPVQVATDREMSTKCLRVGFGSGGKHTQSAQRHGKKEVVVDEETQQQQTSQTTVRLHTELLRECGDGSSLKKRWNLLCGNNESVFKAFYSRKNSDVWRRKCEFQSNTVKWLMIWFHVEKQRGCWLGGIFNWHLWRGISQAHTTVVETQLKKFLQSWWSHATSEAFDMKTPGMSLMGDEKYICYTCLLQYFCVCFLFFRKVNPTWSFSD